MTEYEVRCPHCGALQFMSKWHWLPVPIDQAVLAIKCWRRHCKRVQGWTTVQERIRESVG